MMFKVVNQDGVIEYIDVSKIVYIIQFEQEDKCFAYFLNGLKVELQGGTKNLVLSYFNSCSKEFK